MTTDRISLSIADGVADVRLNRPDKLNALDPAMFAAIAEIGAQLADNRTLRAVVFSGEGEAFCAGLDMERLVATTEGESILPFADLGQRTHGIANFAQHLVWLWRELPVPVIAAVHGIAFGGGFQLMLGADIRYLAPGTRLAIIEAKWGLVPDMAGTQLMRHLAREDVVRELTYTARVFSADDALGYGFATRIVEQPREAALETAHAIADRSPDAIRAAKRLLNLAADRDAATGLAAETAEQALLLGSPNHIEAVRANLERRPPQWSFT
ncbi:crotonase/enoyl-CoA hydratase family protein [Bradyrhizobium elkanii]|uniref:crotonase/enoyl-CoA hydratase family protein n=1 Tax=Bradyrhizobium elkanii TaxID=29448 RepID=UPI0008418DF1|nr:crotonase/enoyl-CoA hydratase family protein [Bradyrhizobium elkanii]ODM74387.1 enoyl-CoA hydratase [Bradyrhizobium elkanii]ODM82898.1 enoyl-CoA hydratase [Bradyrhizobium elkanii]